MANPKIESPEMDPDPVTLKQGTPQSAIGLALFDELAQTKKAELTRLEETISE